MALCANGPNYSRDQRDDLTFGLVDQRRMEGFVEKILTQVSIAGYHGTIEAEICISTIKLVAADVGDDTPTSLEPSLVNGPAGRFE